LNYTKSLDGKKFTPKNFRKLRACQWAVGKISTMKAPSTQAEYKKKVKEVGTYVGKLLGHHSVKGNAYSEALKTYIDPSVFSEWRKKGW